MDMLGDFGGLQEVLFIFIAFLVAPYAEHSFILKAIRKLYVAKTASRELFDNPISEKHNRKRSRWDNVAKKLNQ